MNCVVIDCGRAIIIVVFFGSGLFRSCDSQTTPRDYQDCPLNQTSPFSYVVMVWNFRARARVSFGAMVTATTAVSVAWRIRTQIQSPTFLANGGYRNYKIYGQNIWNYSSPLGHTHPCFQMRTVTHVTLHPKSNEDASKLVFDFSFIRIDRPFTLVNQLVPAMSVSNSPLQLLLTIRFFNIRPDVSCKMPLSLNSPGHNYNSWNFDTRIDVKSIPFKSRCVKLVCEQQPSYYKKDLAKGVSPRWVAALCETKLRALMNASALCVYPPGEKNLFQFDNVKDYAMTDAGLPLVCNGSTIGLESQKKDRAEGYVNSKSPRDLIDQDFFFVNTLLRILPWLNEQIRGTIPTASPKRVQEKDFSTQLFPSPPRDPTPDWGLSDFFKLADGYTFPTHPHEKPAPRSIAPGNLPPSSLIALLAFTILCQNTLPHH